MGKIKSTDLSIHQVSALRGDQPRGAVTVEGVEPLLAAVRLYSGMRRPAEETLFMRCADLSERLARVVGYLADKHGMERDDLRQHVLIALWKGVNARAIETTSEKLFFQYVFTVGRHHAMRVRQMPDALTRSVSIDDDASRRFDESAVFSDAGQSVEETEARMDGARRERTLSRFLDKARERFASDAKATLTVTASNEEAASTALTPTRKLGGTKHLLDPVARLVGIEFRKVTMGSPHGRPHVPDQPRRRGRPPGPSTVAERRTLEQDELYRLYQMSCMRPADYAEAVGVSAATLNKYFSATVQVPEAVLVRAREHMAQIQDHAKELRRRYDVPMSKVVERWGIEIVGRPLSPQELADALDVTVSTTRRWRDNEGKPAINRLAAMELQLRQHYGQPH